MLKALHSHDRTPLDDKALATWVLIGFFYTSWMVYGAAFPDITAPLLLWSALTFILFLSAPLLPVKTLAGFARTGRALFRDPLFYIWLALLMYVGVQWHNAWWIRFEPGEWVQWFDKDAPRPHWPSAVHALDARLFFTQIAASGVAVFALRHGLTTRASLRFFFAWLATGAFLLAVFGLIQYASGTDYLYWYWPRTRHFFASFFYENHAAQYFYLSLSLALGLATYQLCARKMVASRRALNLWLITLATVFMAIVLSLSRTGIIFGIGLLIIGMIYMVRHFPDDLAPMIRLRFLVLLSAICLSGLVWVSGTLGEDLKRDFVRTRPGQSLLENAYAARVWQWEAAVDMWKTRPLFGVGTGGFAFFIPFYTPEPYIAALSKDHAGQTHNDALQFLAEQGLVGISLLIAWFVILVAPLARSKTWNREWIWFPTLGLWLVLAHSLWDLPFRSPAVWFLWAVVAASVGRFLKLPSLATGDEVHNVMNKRGTT